MFTNQVGSLMVPFLPRRAGANFTSWYGEAMIYGRTTQKSPCGFETSTAAKQRDTNHYTTVPSWRRPKWKQVTHCFHVNLVKRGSGRMRSSCWTNCCDLNFRGIKQIQKIDLFIYFKYVSIVIYLYFQCIIYLEIIVKI